MSFPRYPKYKDSGVEWLGEVPEEWKFKPLKHVADFVNGAAFKPSDWSESGMPIIRIQNLNGGDDFNFYDGMVEDRYLVHDDDLLFGWSGNRGTSFGPFIWKHPDVCVLNQHIFRVIPKELQKHELFWTLKAVTAHIEDHAHGIIGMVHITKGDLGAIAVPVPPLPEQQAVAAFLDRETAKIDALVAEQENLIALLKEKRQAVISHAVTKGLDPTVPMKDSGIEWLAEVPEHWNVRPLRYLVASIESGTSVNAIDCPVSEGELGVLKTSCVYTTEFNPEENKTVIPEEFSRVSCPLRAGTLIVSRMNTPELVGAAGLVREDRDKLFLPDRLWQVSFENSRASYMHYWTQTIHYRAQVKMACAGTSSSMQNLSQDQFNSFVLAVPHKIQEQDSIVDYLDTETTKLDDLTTEARHTIDLLKERRSALIFAAVTGKIDVRNCNNMEAA